MIATTTQRLPKLPRRHIFAEEKRQRRALIQRRHDMGDIATRRDLTRCIARLQRSIRRREARLRRLGKAPPTMTDFTMLTEETGREFTMPTTTRQAILDHYETNYGGGGAAAQQRLNLWTSRRNAARRPLLWRRTSRNRREASGRHSATMASHRRPASWGHTCRTNLQGRPTAGSPATISCHHRGDQPGSRCYRMAAPSAR